MSNDAMRLEEHSTGNGVYVIDPGVFLLVLPLAILGVVGFGIGSIFLFRHPHAVNRILVVMYPLVTLGLVAYTINLARYRGRTMQITDDGVSVRDRHGKLIENLLWIELAKVSERRQLGQIVLWDKTGEKRVFIEQEYEHFTKIRSRVLEEYAKAFVPQSLPFTFHNSLLVYNAFVYAAGAAIFGWVAWQTHRQDQPGASLIFLCLTLFISLSTLRYYPQLRGPSVLDDDRIVLRRILKTEEVYKKDVLAIELRDVANPKSGTRFSLVALKMTNGGELKITSTYGTIPEIYLTLNAWLARR